MVQSRPRRPPSCLQNTTTLYRHLTAAGSWEWYDHGHDGPPRVCRIQLHCTHTYVQLQVLGSSTITATTAPLVFVEYNYIVPTPYSCRFLGVVRSRPRRPPSCLQNITTLYRHLTDPGSWEYVEYNYIVPTPYSCRFLGMQYDHGHDGPPRVCRIQLHCTHTLDSCRFLGVVRSRTRGPPRVCRIQLHCTNTLQLQVLGSSTITATTAPLVAVEYNYIVPTPYRSRFLGVVRSRPRRPPSCLQKLQPSCIGTGHLVFVDSCRFLGVVRSRPRRPPSCLQNITTLYRHLTDPGSWEQYDHGHDGPPRVCRIQLHCTEPYSCRFLGVVRSRPRRPPSCLQNTTTLYRPYSCRFLGVVRSTATTAPLVFVEYNYIVPTSYRSRFLGVVRSCLQTDTLH